MLQYDDADHSLTGAAAEDFSMRLMQFFDHFLKGAPTPNWMIAEAPGQSQGADLRSAPSTTQSLQ
jgi:hypothetical protein